MDEKLRAFIVNDLKHHDNQDEIEKLISAISEGFSPICLGAMNSVVSWNLAINSIVDSDIIIVISDLISVLDSALLGIAYGLGIFPDPINGCEKRPIISIRLSPDSKILSDTVLGGLVTAQYDLEGFIQDLPKIKALASVGVYR